MGKKFGFFAKKNTPPLSESFEFQPRLAKRCSVPFPIQILIVVVGIGASYGGGLNQNFNVAIAGDIPKG